MTAINDRNMILKRLPTWQDQRFPIRARQLHRLIEQCYQFVSSTSSQKSIARSFFFNLRNFETEKRDASEQHEIKSLDLQEIYELADAGGKENGPYGPRYAGWRKRMTANLIVAFLSYLVASQS